MLPLRIAQVTPLHESVPPKLYGGTERVVSYLTEELVRQGHHVTLFASGDSVTSARLVACCRKSLRLDEQCVDPWPHHILMVERVLGQVADFDLVHFHTDYFHFPFARRLRLQQVTTLHGRQDIPDLAPLYREFRDLPLVSISDAQRAPLAWANWVATVPHGLPAGLYQPCLKPGKYLAFLGRISPEKRVDQAVQIARRAGLRLKVAAKIDKADQEYYKSEIAPLMRDPLVEFLGEIGEHEKQEFLASAYALLFPIDWPEPFGLVMIEAMACGTPVIAFRRGSVPEVIDAGESGFIVDSVEEAIRAVERVQKLDRAACRACFDRRFTAECMARGYLEVYERLLTPQFEEPGMAA